MIVPAVPPVPRLSLLPASIETLRGDATLTVPPSAMVRTPAFPPNPTRMSAAEFQVEPDPLTTSCGTDDPLCAISASPLLASDPPFVTEKVPAPAST